MSFIILTSIEIALPIKYNSITNFKMKGDYEISVKTVQFRSAESCRILSPSRVHVNAKNIDVLIH